MPSIQLSSVALGWAAMSTGVMGVLALIFIILFFTIGQPFGTLNDICIGLTAILSAWLVWVASPPAYAQSPIPGWVAMGVALAGALVVVAGAVLVVFGITGWYLAGLYMAAGNALIGVWLVGLCYFARGGDLLPSGLAVFGLIVGALMLLGLAAVPGIVSGIASWNAAPWYVNYVGQASALGWLVLYPIWCILLGRTFFLK